MFKKTLFSLLIVASFSLTAQVKLHKAGGKVVEGPSVVYKGGKLHLKMKDGGGSTLHDITQVLRVESLRSTRSEKMWERFIKGDFKLVGGTAGKAEEEKNRYLGWGKRTAFAYCYSMLKNGNTKDAAAILSKANGYMRGNDDKLDMQLITIALAQADFISGADSSRAQKKLDAIAKDLEEDARPFFYNLQGDILMKKGEASTAVLSYYKTLLLDKTISYQRDYAKSKITEVYKSQNDDKRIKSLKNL